MTIAENLHRKKTIKKDIYIIMDATTKNNKQKHLKKQHPEDTIMNGNMSEEVFSWLPEFNKVYSSVKNRNYWHLEQLLSHYTQ